MRNKFFLSIIVIVFFASCKKSFLDKVPPSSLTSEIFFKTASDFNLATIGIYDVLQGRSYSESSWALMEMSTDNTYTNAPAGAFGEIWYQVEEFRILQDNAHLNNQWQFSYRAIGRANTVINRIANVQFAQTLKDQYEGEALFLRASMYFNLVRLFGDVPIVLEEQSVLNSFRISRQPVAEVYQQIILDLTAADIKLPLAYTGNDIGRATRGAAKAMLGKVYLTQKNYTEAAAKLREVIALGRYNLLPNIVDVFRASNANHAESIFEIQFKAGQGADREGSNFVEGMAPATQRINAMYVLGTPTTGQGNGVVTRELFDAFSPTDTRRNATIGRIGSGPSEVFFQRKYATPTAIFLDAEDNFTVLRYSDVLLMLAEALNEQTFGSVDAFRAINDVRRRAGLTDLDSGTTPTQQVFRNALLNERRFEFAFENQRWFDLLRFDQAIPILTSKGLSIRAFNVLFPIPLRERLLAGLSQNPGY